MALHSNGRRHALELALKHELPAQITRAYFNLAYSHALRGEIDEGLDADEKGLAYSRRIGSRSTEWSFLGHLIHTHFFRGDWETGIELAREIPRPDSGVGSTFAWQSGATPLAYIHSYRGELDEAWDSLQFFEQGEKSADVQSRASYASPLALLRQAQGRFDEAAELGRIAWDTYKEMKPSKVYCIIGLVVAVEMALQRGDEATVQELLGQVDAIPPSQKRGFLVPHVDRLQALRSIAKGDNALVENFFLEAIRGFDSMQLKFWRAQAQLE